MKQVNIAMLGLGTVGQGVLKIINDNKDKIESISGIQFRISKVLIRNPKKYEKFADTVALTTNFDDILNDPSLNLVIEVMGGINPAYSYIKSLLIHGKNVITANKDLLATKGSELNELAQQNSVSFRYEAAVAGGIPILNILSQNFASDQIESVTGIINGTCNYILTKMSTENLSFNEALKLAQKNGFAEQDPTNDIEGIDAAYKLAILCDFAFGKQVSSEQISNEGIKNISNKDMQVARKLGYQIKLLAYAYLTNGKLVASVRPFFVSNSKLLSQIDNEQNVVEIDSKYLGKSIFVGAGAGSLPTANSVVSDLLIEANNLKKGTPQQFNKYHQIRKVISDSKKCEYVIILKDEDKPLITDEVEASQLDDIILQLNQTNKSVENIYPIY